MKTCILIMVTMVIFNFSTLAFSNNLSNLIIQDSASFSKVESEFNLLMDTTSLNSYKKFKKTYREIIELTSYPGAKYDFTEFDKLYNGVREEIRSKINGFSKIVILATFDTKIVKRLNESKSAFITAYEKLFDAIEKLYLYSKERFGVYLIDYNNIMLEFDSNFNKGIIKFAQAKIKIK